MELVTAHVKFRPYGREPFAPRRSGLDCAGVIEWVSRELNILDEVKIPPYSFPPQREVFETFGTYCDEITEPREGAIILFKTSVGSPVHSGFMTRANNEWNVIGISPVIRRPFVTVYPLDDAGLLPWRYYDFRVRFE